MVIRDRVKVKHSIGLSCILATHKMLQHTIHVIYVINIATGLKITANRSLVKVTSQFDFSSSKSVFDWSLICIY